jgi:hypothetical protein
VRKHDGKHGKFGFEGTSVGHSPVKEADVSWFKETFVAALGYVALSVQLQCQAEARFSKPADLCWSAHEVLWGAEKFKKPGLHGSARVKCNLESI